MGKRKEEYNMEIELDLHSGDLYRGYAGIHLDIIRQHIKEMKKNMASDALFMAVVKADGYGHGASAIAEAVKDEIDGCAVATVDEAVSLREHGFDKRILVLGFVHESLYYKIIDYDISISIYTLYAAERLSICAQKEGKQAYIHISLDTGMSRLGARDDEMSIEMIEKIKGLPNLVVEGIFTHFTSSDEADKEKSYHQLKRFTSFLEALEKRGIDIPIKHCSNSAGIIDLPEANFNMVRAGIALYGLYPSEEVKKQAVKLRPALELKSHIVYLKDVEANTGISYGSTYVTTKRTKIATIPIGYGDGYPRGLSNRGFVLIRGKRVPIRGRICMDQFMVDVSEIPDVKENDEVVLIGKDGEEQISVEELASLVGTTFHYEIICNLGKRIPRVYFEGEHMVGYRPYLPLLQ